MKLPLDTIILTAGGTIDFKLDSTSWTELSDHCENHVLSNVTGEIRCHITSSSPFTYTLQGFDTKSASPGEFFYITFWGKNPNTNGLIGGNVWFRVFDDDVSLRLKLKSSTTFPGDNSQSATGTISDLSYNMPGFNSAYFRNFEGMTKSEVVAGGYAPFSFDITFGIVVSETDDIVLTFPSGVEIPTGATPICNIIDGANVYAGSKCLLT